MNFEKYEKYNDKIVELNGMAVNSIIEGTGPVKAIILLNMMSIKIFFIRFFFKSFNFLLKSMVKINPNYFIHRMFYIRQNDLFLLRKDIWLIYNNKMPFVIKTGDNYHHHMINNTNLTTKKRRRKMREFLEKNFYFDAIYGVWEASKIKQKILKKRSNEYVKSYYNNQDRINESIKRQCEPT